MKKELKNQIIETISAELNAYPDFYITDISGRRLRWSWLSTAICCPDCSVFGRTWKDKVADQVAEVEREV